MFCLWLQLFLTCAIFSQFFGRSCKYANSMSMKMLSLYFYQLMGKTEEQEEKKSLMVDDYMTNKVLYNIKEIIGTETFDDNKILINTDDKLPDGIT